MGHILTSLLIRSIKSPRNGDIISTAFNNPVSPSLVHRASKPAFLSKLLIYNTSFYSVPSHDYIFQKCFHLLYKPSSCVFRCPISIFLCVPFIFLNSHTPHSLQHTILQHFRNPYMKLVHMFEVVNVIYMKHWRDPYKRKVVQNW